MPPLATFRRSVAASPRRTDAVVAAVMAAVSVAQVLIVPIAPRGLGVAIALVSTVPIAFRRAHPVAAATVGILPWAVETDGYLVLGYVAVILLFYMLAAEVDDLRVVAAVAVLALALSFTTLVRLDEGIAEYLSSMLAVIAPCAVGRLVRRERATAQRIAVAEERARIAREHDPSRASAPLETIRGSAHEALSEMRRMLGVLREDDEGSEHGPQPGLAQLPTLLEHARAAGVPVEVVTSGEPRPLTASLDLTAYRILQEALTNVRRHAPGAPTTVGVGWTPAALLLEVRDRGPGPNGVAGGGHGLVGMHERVRIHGGRLHTGAAPEGGFEVVAELPLP